MLTTSEMVSIASVCEFGHSETWKNRGCLHGYVVEDYVWWCNYLGLGMCWRRKVGEVVL